MRGGPGLGSIGPSQADYFQATKGHGHGDYRVPVLAPSSIAEAVDLVADAFEIAERYRTPTMLLADGVMGQAMEPVVPTYRTPARPPDDWQLDRRRRSAASCRPFAAPPARGPRGPRPASPGEVPRRSRRTRVRWAGEPLDDAEIAIVAYGTSARVARTAIERAREHGLARRAVPADHAVAVPDRGPRGHRRRARGPSSSSRCRPGRCVEDVRLAVGDRVPVLFHGRMGGMVPTPGEVVDARSAGRGRRPSRAADRRGRGDDHPNARARSLADRSAPRHLSPARRRWPSDRATTAPVAGTGSSTGSWRSCSTSSSSAPRTIGVGVGRLQRLRLRLPAGRLRRVAARACAGGRDRRPPRRAPTRSSSPTRATATSPRSGPPRSSTRRPAASGSASSSSTTASTG